jgi:magnesium chelatase family protein
MSLAIVYSRALEGLSAPRVTVEVHLANGLPSFTLVGLADTEVKEARERVRAAILNSGLDFPYNKRITVNLAPADLPKESGRFDLPIAVGILAAAEALDVGALQHWEFAGELSLSGELRPVRGALAMALALKRSGLSRSLVLPQGSAQEAALVQGLPLYQAGHLVDVVKAFKPQGAEREPLRAATPLGAMDTAPAAPDLREVKGQAAAKRALEIAAAGGHSMVMVGPPGTGKSMLAQRFTGLLPPLSEDEALESAALLSLVGDFRPERWAQRLFRSPHHTASAVALVGGGSPPRPGEISLAHHGVLFLDELPEFPRAALEALREPLENGCITIARAARRAEYPARFQLIAAMNPCPCGHAGSAQRVCRCSPDTIARYQARLSGPLLDRIDLQVEVPPVTPEVLAHAPDGEPSRVVAQRVARVRRLQQARQAGLNGALQGQELETHARPQPAAADFLKAAAAKLAWSARSFHRVLRLARTIADLADAEEIAVAHVAEAIQYRRVLVNR